MSFCQSTAHSNQAEEVQTEAELEKFSLRDHVFKHRRNNQGFNQDQERGILANSRFAEFLSQHNTGLIRKESSKEAFPLQSGHISNCFQSARHVVKSGKGSTQPVGTHRQTSSTLSSFHESQIVSQRLNAGLEGSSIPAFKINTRSIIKELFQEQSEMHEELKSMTNSGELDISIDFNLSRLREGEVRSLLSSGRSSLKMSLKQDKEKDSNKNGESDISQNRKQSLHYVHLSDNFNFGKVFQLELADSKTTIQTTKAVPLSHFQRRLEKEGSECACGGQDCRSLKNWMRQVSPYKGASFGNVAIDSKTLVQIERDVPRTHIANTQAGLTYCQQHLKDLLVNYSVLHPEIGYIQGMNIIAAAIIAHTNDLAKSTAIFNHIMTDLRYGSIFEGDLSLGQRLSSHLHQELARYSNKLYLHLIEGEVELEMFVRSWYFSMLGSFIPLRSMPFVIDKFMAKGFKGINEVILIMLIYLKRELLATPSEDLAVKLSNSWLVERSKLIDWAELVTCSENIMLRPCAI